MAGGQPITVAAPLAAQNGPRRSVSCTDGTNVLLTRFDAVQAHSRGPATPQDSA